MTTQEQSRRSPGFRLGVGGVVVVVLVALAVTIVIGMLRTTRPEAVAIESSADADAVTAPAVFVHVSGAVAGPGLYHLAAGARVFDAVSAAGGLTAEADSSAVNLARLLTDGEQLHVPTIAETAESPPGGSGSPGAAEAGGKINLNTADLAALDTLPRVGPAIAQRIIDWREANGRFTSVDDLLSVPGIGEKMLAGLRDLVTV